MDSTALIFALLGVFLAIAHLIKSSGKVEVDQREQYTKMFKDLYEESRVWRERQDAIQRLNFKIALLRERTILAHALIEELLESCDQLQIPKTIIAFLSEEQWRGILTEEFNYGAKPPDPSPNATN
jgi:hypothetical protein